MNLLIAFVLLLKSFVLCEINNEIVNKEAESCGATCDKTYTLHTYPSADNSEACKRGCRLFAVLHVLGESNSLNGTRESCDSSCTEAYKKAALRYACTLGCNSQPVNSPNLQQEEAKHAMKPLMYVQVVYSNLAGRVKQFVSHSWAIYMQQGKLVEGQDKPQILQEIESEDDGLSESHEIDLNEDKFDFATEEMHHIPFAVVRGSSSQGRPSLGRREYLHIQSVDGAVSLDWLSCISRQSGLPRRLLLLVLMLAVVVMVWLCCATAATAPEQRIKPQNIEYYNDLTYLLDHQKAEKIQIQPPPSYFEAPPLPAKVKLEDNLV